MNGFGILFRLHFYSLAYTEVAAFNTSIYYKVNVMKYSALTIGCIVMFSGFSSISMAEDAKKVEAVPAPRHGTSEIPPSRQYYCYSQKDFGGGSGGIKNAACKAAYEAAGNENWERERLFNNWNTYSQNAPKDQWQTKVPDEQLCSAGIENYKSINLPSAEWHATELDVKEGRVALDYKASQMHDPSEFTVYLSKPGFDSATSKLKWADLQEAPEVKFVGVPDDAKAVPGHYKLDVKLPDGYTTDKKAIIYIAWARHEDPARETFFSCSDVILKNTAG
ncbi:lytic polysaccharide monooxygenase [Enterobacter asburiae]